MKDNSKDKPMTNAIESLVGQYEHGVISRRQLLTGLATITSMAIPQSGNGEEDSRRGSAIEAESAFKAKSLNHVTLSVSNVKKSQHFYESILGLSVVSKQKNGVNLGLGDSFLGLYEIKETPRINHFCLGLDQFQVQVAADRLKEFGIRPQVRLDKPEVYFRDPDGITVQLENKKYQG